MYGFVYLTTNKTNNKKYIGICKNTHRDNYLGSGKLLKRAIDKYGKENFTREIIEECSSLEHLLEAEERHIKEHNAVESDNYYNLREGGNAGISESMTEYWSKMTAEERKTARNWSKTPSNGMLGKTHSEETKRKIGSKSVNRKWGRKTTTAGKNNPKARPALAIRDEKCYNVQCLKDLCEIFPDIPYSTLKTLAKNHKYSKRHNIEVKYV